MTVTSAPSAASREIERLSKLHPQGIDLSLERISKLLTRLGDPQNRLPPVIHIAGTNGKGSAAAFSRALLEADGKLVHTHTSPHLVNWHERYRIARPGGSKFVADDVLADAVSHVASINRDLPITIFEILTAVTFLLFSEYPADAAIIEVGLGGRFDATNVVSKPAVSLIMPISLDHQAYLGDKVELIAAEKAGIIKPSCPVVIGAQEFDAARELLCAIADRQNCPLSVYGQDFLAFEENGRLIYQDHEELIDLTLPKLVGRHQYANAAASIAAVKAAGFQPAQDAIERAMSAVEWPGRMQILPQGHVSALAPDGAEVWIDGGHNPGAGMVVAEALGELEERFSRPLFLIAGMIDTKDQTGYFRAFQGMVRRVYTVPVTSSPSGVANSTLAMRAGEAGLLAEPADSVADALSRLRAICDQHKTPPRILIGGSLYLVGSVLAENGTPPA